MGFSGVPEANDAAGLPVKNQKFAGEEHRDIIKASVRTSVRPGCRARGPSLPSSSSMRRVPGRRGAVRCNGLPPGVYGTSGNTASFLNSQVHRCLMVALTLGLRLRFKAFPEMLSL